MNNREHSEREHELQHDLDHFNAEKERVRELVGKIGGTKMTRRDTIINIIFLSAVVILFILEIAFQIVPTYISLEIGVLLISVKIVWMIHSHNKLYHFQFWILNSIEYRVNEMSRIMTKIHTMIDQDSKP